MKPPKTESVYEAVAYAKEISTFMEPYGPEAVEKAFLSSLEAQGWTLTDALAEIKARLVKAMRPNN